MKKKSELTYERRTYVNGDVICKCAKHKCKNPSECKANLIVNENASTKDMGITFNEAVQFFNNFISR